MSDILAVFRVAHPDLALTATVAHDESAVVRPVREAGTDPQGDRYLFSVTSADFDRFEAGLDADPTVATYQRVVRLDDEAVYALGYAADAVLLSTEIVRRNGVILEFENEGTTWVLKIWFPDREAARGLWDFATDHDLDVELVRVNEYGSILEHRYGLTDAQREAVLVALDAGYFDEPRGATLGEVAETLDISKPSASRLLRRALKRLVRSTLAEAER
ncbi:MAG: helix-turn-helix domain-containing protein [Halobacteriales archaeon]